MNAFFIAIMDFAFSIAAAFIVWSGLAILVLKRDDSAFQTSSSGLTFIAFPQLAERTDSYPTFACFCLFLWVSGIDSAISYMEAYIANLAD